MSYTDSSVEELRQEISREFRELKASVRRLSVSITRGVMWTLRGHILADGKRESVQAEVFSGVGFYSRPAPGVNAEAIVAHIGGAASNPAIVATRDEDTRKRVAPLDQDETAMFNTLTIVQCVKTGKIEARAVGGAAIPLATLVDLQNHKTWDASHTHPAPGGATGVPAVAPPDPVGTTVLMGQ